jgi:hypothetical protein
MRCAAWQLAPFIGFLGCSECLHTREILLNVTIVVNDSCTMAPLVGTPSFTIDTTRTYGVMCSQLMADAGDSCPSWKLSIGGRHTLTVSAAGYRDASVVIDGGTNDCGPTFNTANLTLTLTKLSCP